MSYCNDHLRGIINIHDQTLNNEIQDNLIEFFDWGLLEKGNYFNVTLSEQSYDGYDYSLLKKSSNENFRPGQAWDGFRKNWVWQSGISPSGMTPPIVGSDNSKPGISGVYVNDTFYPSNTTGAYAHNVDYFNGRVVFDNPIPIDSKVQAEFSYKYINVIYATSVPWIREFYLKTLDVSNRDSITIQPEMQIQLPAIAVEIVSNRHMKPFQLGPLGQFVYTDVLFHCIAEDDYTKNKLIDIITMQNDLSVNMFNTNLVSKASDFPLSNMGYPVSGALRFPDLVSKYQGDNIYLRQMKVQAVDMINSNLHVGIVRSTCENISSTF